MHWIINIWNIEYNSVQFKIAVRGNVLVNNITKDVILFNSGWNLYIYNKKKVHTIMVCSKFEDSFYPSAKYGF